MGDAAIDRRKGEARRELKELRATLNEDARLKMDADICERLLGTAAYEGAELVLSYLSFGSEVSTWPLIRRAWADGKKVAIPRCEAGSRVMRWFEVDSFEDLVSSKHGMHEPDPEIAHEVDPAGTERALAVVPAFTFDAAGYRLGYGGGFYDTFLAGFGGTSVGLCRACQMSEDLQAAGLVDDHDCKVDIVVTDTNAIDT